MRKIPWPVVGLAGLAVIVGGTLLYRATSAPSPAPGTQVTETVPLRAPALAVQPPDGTPAATPPLPVSPAPAAPSPDTASANAATETADAATQVADAAAQAQPSPAPAEKPATETASAGADLPVVNVPPRVVHVVPEKEPVDAPSVTVTDKNGRVMSHIVPRPASPVAAMPPAPAPLNGVAQVGNPTVIMVSGQPVRLFGVRPADPTDVCLSKAGRAQPCADAARDALAARLGTFSDVHCRMPPGRRGDGSSICLDGAGVDLAGYLVGEGLALANPRESNDYVGAEGVARANKRGLWHYR